MSLLDQTTKELIRNTSLICDADAIINLSKYAIAEDMSEFEECKCELLYIQQVLLELMRTDTSIERTRRQIFLQEYNFNLLPKIEVLINEKTNNLQLQLHNYNCHPSPTDLYLGACLTQYFNMCLLTGNLKDFPRPIYRRDNFIILESDREVKTLAIISLSNVAVKNVKQNTFRPIRRDEIQF